MQFQFIFSQHSLLMRLLNWTGRPSRAVTMLWSLLAPIRLASICDHTGLGPIGLAL